ncbi:DUF2997 domain-containing protein [Paenibacillus sp. FSL R5-0527]|uniref:DUF2997 domain-containing protein n=1 Tax=Paenibacillus sp. FSL R5-0527 TaxID=2975321 RepID=UPI00097B1979|nr:hypothetical protein BK140_16460 [Paenibacillus macerans]
MDEKIQIRICPDGRIEVETLGITGEKCKDVIGLLEELLDAEVVETTLKPEFYETDGLKIRETLRREE